MKIFLITLSLMTFCAFGKSPVVLIETNMGTIEVELNQDKAPVTVKNFLNYVDSKFYNGLIFHRVIDGFMIQGGGFDEKMMERKTKDPIKNEANNGLLNDTGSISMARTADPNSATAQFFINVNDNNFLDSKHTAFGKVVSGMDVVEAIENVQTGSGDRPVEAVIIVSVETL
jgi:peptidyl-prolyl cis-trans isomerase A (cyclophilin A)